MTHRTVTARVRVEMEITIGGTWTETATMKQIAEQAMSEAQGFVRNLKGNDRGRLTIIGKPVVSMVMVTEDQR